MFVKCDMYKKEKRKKLIITSMRCDIARWHIQVRRYVCKKEKPNGVYFEMRKKEERIEIESRSFTILCTKKKNKFIDFVDDYRLFLALQFFCIQNLSIDINIYICIIYKSISFCSALRLHSMRIKIIQPWPWIELRRKSSVVCILCFVCYS